MKKLISFLLVASLLFALTGIAGAEISRVKEYQIPARVNTLEVASFHGSITWLPAPKEEARILVEIAADGVSQGGVRTALTQIRIVENIKPGSILLEARTPALPSGVDYLKVNYFIYAPPGQFRQFKAETKNGVIEIAADFNGVLTLLNNNGPIVLKSGRGSVNLATTNGLIELGTLDLTLASTVKTTNGSISGTVSLPDQGTFLFETTNAPIELKLPADTVGTFQLKSTFGTIDFRLGEDILNGISSALIARGKKPLIKVTTSHSPIVIFGSY